MPKYYRVRTPEQWDWLADKLNIYCVKSMACPVIIEHEQGQKDYRIVQYYGGFEPIIEVSQMMEESRMEDYVTIKSEDLDKIKFNRPQEDGNSFVVNKINVISEKPVKCVRDVELPTDLLIPKSLLYPKVKFTEEEKREFDDIKKHVTALYNAMVLIFEHRDECINLNNKLFYSAPPKYLNDVQRDFARAWTDESLIEVIPDKKWNVKVPISCGADKKRKVEGGYTDIILDLPNETITAVGEDILKIQVSYCPMCGRRLAEK